MKQEEISRNTKKALGESLKKAMKKKPFQKITVSELIQDCNVNRKTFYYHFQDIYALLKWVLEEESIQIVKHYDLLVEFEEVITFVMDYVEKNDYILSCARDSIGSEGLKHFFSADFLEISLSLIEQAERFAHKTLDPAYKEFLSHFYVGAVSNILAEWFENREICNREEVTQYLSATVKDSLIGILRA